MNQSEQETHPSLLSRDLSGLPVGLSPGVFLNPDGVYPREFLDPDVVSPGVFLEGEEGERE